MKQLAISTNTTPKPQSMEIFDALNIEPGISLKATLMELEYGDRQWGFNLCRAIEHLWHLGAPGRNLKGDLTAILNYLRWDSEDYEAGLVSRSEADLKLIWQAISILYLKISEIK